VDYCGLFQTDSHACIGVPGCSHCSVYRDDFGSGNNTLCYSNQMGRRPEACYSFETGVLEFNDGSVCPDTSCEDTGDCQSCLSNWHCQWCLGHQKDKCSDSVCANVDGHDMFGRCVATTSSDSTTKAPKNNGEEFGCWEIDNCERCFSSRKHDCVWTRRRNPNNSESNQGPDHLWNCMKRSTVERFKNSTLLQMWKCAAPCVERAQCTSCLESGRIKNGGPECVWSEQSKSCLTRLSITLLCFGGGANCGRLYTDDCPKSCGSFSTCRQCLAGGVGCGWCAADEISGVGTCAEGTTASPHGGGADCIALAANRTKSNLILTDSSQWSSKILMDGVGERVSVGAATWNFFACPTENECLNGHHDCDTDSEECVDTAESYECVCKKGYKRSEGKCLPACDNGCVHGDCVAPDVCRCHFSYVGPACKDACHCNLHSDCGGPDELDVCLECKNNTMGDLCEVCEPLYVGDPTNGGDCQSCLDYCHGGSPHCFAEMWFALLGIEGDRGEDEVEVVRINSERDLSRLIGASKSDAINGIAGSEDQDQAVCVNCKPPRVGRRCEHCAMGYFGTPSKEGDCRPCQCNGHGTVCDRQTGENCQCYNNTVSDFGQCAADRRKMTRRKDNQRLKSCFEFQCNKCRDYFVGSPSKGGQQCFRQMSVNSEFCLDMEPLGKEDCNENDSVGFAFGDARRRRKRDPTSSSFFAVQPKFMNVDIRVFLDVSVGIVDVLIAPTDKLFHYIGGDLSLHKRARRAAAASGGGDTEYGFVEEDAGAEGSAMAKFVHLSNPETILHVKNLSRRLVITLPEDNHDLRTTRYVILNVFL
jgi:hypothetical protein